MMKHIALALMILALVLPMQAAAYPEAALSVETSVDSVCPCSTLTSDDVSVVVGNLDDKEATYNLELVLPDDELWSGFIVPSVTLAGGAEADVAVFVTPSCWAKPGKYTIGVSASSDVSGKVTTKEFELDVAKCRWVGIEADNYDLCQGKVSSFDVVLTNDGLEDETVKLSTDVDWATFAEDVVPIATGESRTVRMDFSPPKDLEGVGDVKIMLNSDTSYVSNQKTIELDVRKCYGTEFSVIPAAQDVCPCKSAEFTVGMKNSGIFGDNYTVSYASNSETIPLASGKEASVGLTIDVPCDREEGDYPLNITIDSMDPNAPYVSTVSVGVLPVGECYSVNLSSDESEPRSIEVGESAAFTLTVGNGGMFARSYDIELDAPDWVHLSKTKVDLEPGYAEQIYMYAAPGYGTDEGNYSVSVTAVGENEQANAVFEMEVVSDFEGAENASGSISMNMSIPTGEAVGSGSSAERPWSQIMMIAILAIGVVFVLILRFVVMMK